MQFLSNALKILRDIFRIYSQDLSASPKRFFNEILFTQKLQSTIFASRYRQPTGNHAAMHSVQVETYPDENCSFLQTTAYF